MPRAMALDGKRCCGLPRKVVLCTVSCLVCAIVVVLTTVLLTLPPDDIQTVDQTEGDVEADDGDLTVLKKASFSGVFVTGSLSLVRVIDGNSSYLALNSFALDEPCDDLEIRLMQGAGFASTTSVGDLAVPLPAGETDFVEPLGTDFDANLYDQASLWCVTDASQGGETQLHDGIDLLSPLTLDGGRVLLREASMTGSDPYIVGGLVQIVGSVSITDGVLVTTYSLRFQDIEVSEGPDVYLYLTADLGEPENVGAEGSIRVELDDSERGTFSFTGTFTQETLPDGFVAPETYVAAVVWCDEFNVFFGSGAFEDV